MAHEYTKEQIDLIRAKVDILRQTPIYEILLAEGKDVRHTRSGLYHSPFREDSKPSFHVDEANHRFSDPGDFDESHKKPGAKQAGGDTVDLVMWLKGCTYTEALIYLYELNPSVEIAQAASTPSKSTSSALNGFVNHSGGAWGADTEWGKAGETYGVKSMHYYHGRKTPSGNILITDDMFREGMEHVRRANLSLHRSIDGKPDWMYDLIARDWIQVRESDAVFAVSSLDPNGRLVYRDGSGYTPVKGGTGWAVQMAMDAGKPIFLYDQERRQWMRFSGPDHERFGWTVLDEAPVLTKNFAGIGTRNLNDAGKQAIKDAYYATVKSLLMENSQKEQTAENAIKVSFSIDSGNPLSIDTPRPFSVKGNRFTSVYQWAIYDAAMRCGEKSVANGILAASDRSAIDAFLDCSGVDLLRDITSSSLSVGTRLSMVMNPDALDRLMETGTRPIVPSSENDALDIAYASALMEVRESMGTQMLNDSGEYRSISSIDITEIKPRITSRSLRDYETQTRRIDPLVLDRYCSQVNYSIIFRSQQGEKTMQFMAVGFPNRAGEWTLRGAPYITQDGAQKSGIKRSTGNDITIINCDGDFCNKSDDEFIPTRDSVVVFEGFNDFLAWRTRHGSVNPGNCDVVVLNSVVNAERAVPVLANYNRVFTYLDNDETGKRTTSELKSALTGKVKEFKDCTYFFGSKGFNDFNEYWINEANARIQKGEDIRIKLNQKGPSPQQEPKPTAQSQTMKNKA